MHTRAMAVLLVTGVAAACTDSVRPPTQPEAISVPIQVDSGKHEGTPENHRTHLTGKEEVPARDTRAQGQAIFQISKDGLSVDYRLIASNIENVIMAHIHCGAAGVNGPIVVWLYPSPTVQTAVDPGGGRHNGVLAHGTFDTAHVIARASSAQCPGGVSTLDDVLAKIRTGNAYVNVHTDDGVPPTNTGPGDFPGGEIRGQID